MPLRKVRIYRWAARIAGAIPAVVLAALYFSNQLGVNPIQVLEKRSGDIALVFLLLSLAVSPLRLITRHQALTALRRPLGLTAFYYAALHLLLFVGLDYGFAVGLLLLDLGQKQYVWFGVAAFVILLLLAATSNDHAKMILRKGWKKLHRLVYLAGLLAILHFALSVKGNIFLLRGDIFFPLLALLIWLVLMIFRLPIIHHLFNRRR